MATARYTNDHWSTPLAQRHQEAHQRYLEARERLRRTRERLTAEQPVEWSEVLDPAADIAGSYEPIDPYLRSLKQRRSTEPPRLDIVVFARVREAHRALVRQRYLNDLAWYLQSLAELERLSAELERLRGATPRMNRQPESRAISTASPGPKPLEPDCPEIASLKQQAAVRVKEAIRRLLERRDRISVADLLVRWGNGQLLWSEDEPLMRDAEKAVAEVLPELEAARKAQFDRLPSARNYRSWVQSRADCQNLGVERRRQDPLAGIRRLHQGKEYTTTRGDTLSLIAAKVYGRASLWYLIYEANRGAIEDDPDKLLPGVSLEIP